MYTMHRRTSPASLQIQSFNSKKIYFQSQKKSFIGKAIFILHFTDEFFNCEKKYQGIESIKVLINEIGKKI